MRVEKLATDVIGTNLQHLFFFFSPPKFNSLLENRDEETKDVHKLEAFLKSNTGLD